MCGPWVSSKWLSDAKVVWGESFPVEQFSGEEYRWYEHPNAWQNLIDCLPDLKVLHLTGGEPLLIPEMYKILNRIIDAGEAHHIRLIYNTNMTKIPAELRDLWPQFGWGRHLLQYRWVWCGQRLHSQSLAVERGVWQPARIRQQF